MVFRLQKIALCFFTVVTVGAFVLAYFVIFRDKPDTGTTPDIIADIHPTGAHTIPLVTLSEEVWAQIHSADTPTVLSSVSSVSPLSVTDGSYRYGREWLAANRTDKPWLLTVYDIVEDRTKTANSITAGNYARFSGTPYPAGGNTALNTEYYQVGSIMLTDVDIPPLEILADYEALRDNPESATIIKELQLAVNTFEQDNPQYFSGMVGFSLYYETIPFMGMDMINPSTVEIVPLFPAGYRLYTERAEAQDKVEAKFAEYQALAAAAAGSDADTVRVVHDKIVTERDYANDVYGYPSVEVVAHNIMGVMDLGNFEADKNPVCESYAKANAYILNRLGIECWTVFGDTISGGGGYHAWNIVKINGVWYWHDVTWADTETTYGGLNNDPNNTNNLFNHNWFLQGSDSSWDRHYPNSSYEWTTSYGVGMPVISETDYNQPGASAYNWTQIPQITQLDTAYCSTVNLAAYMPAVTISDLVQDVDFAVLPLNAPTNVGAPSRFLIYGIGPTYRGVGLVTQTLTTVTTDPTKPEPRTAVYGQTLAEVELPDGWRWNIETAAVGNVGTRTHYADFYRYGYTPMSDVPISVVVEKAMPPYSVPAGLTANVWQTLAEVELPAGWAWAVPTDNAGGLGSHTHAAVFTPSDANNYSTVTAGITVTVVKAAPEIPAALTAVYGQKLSAVVLPEGWYWVDGDVFVGEVGTQTHYAGFDADFLGGYGYSSMFDVPLSVTVEPAPAPPDPPDPDPEEPTDPEPEPEPEPTDPEPDQEPEPTEPEPTDPDPTEPPVTPTPAEPAITHDETASTKIDAEMVALAVTGIGCLGLIGFVIRKFLFKK